MKKVRCMLLLCAAQISLAAPHSFTGYYLSAGLGATSATFNVQPNVGVDEIDFKLFGDFDMNATSPSGLIALSYLFEFSNQFVLGAQVTAGYTQTQAGYQPSYYQVVPSAFFDLSSEVQSQLTNDFALLFKPGYVSRTNTLFYLLVGPRWGHFKSSVVADLAVDTGGLFSGYGQDETSGYECGITAGIGIQQQFMDNMHLSLEYAHTDYGSIKSPFVNADIMSGGVSTGFVLEDTPRIEASTNTLMLAFSYQWK